MATVTTVKIIKKKDSAKKITSSYEPFKNPGKRNKVPNELLSEEELNRKCTKKKEGLDKYTRHDGLLDEYNRNNEFNLYVTINNISKKNASSFLERVKKDDSSAEYVTVATWTYSVGLHYHMMIKTTLSHEHIRKLILHAPDDCIDIQDIEECKGGQKGLFGYFRKNINDTKYVLLQTSRTTLDVPFEELREKQLEILAYTKVVNKSRGVKVDAIEVIKDATKADEAKLEQEYNFKESFEWDKASCKTIIDKYTKKEEEVTTTTATITAPVPVKDAQVSKSTTKVVKAPGTTKRPSPIASHTFINTKEFNLETFVSNTIKQNNLINLTTKIVDNKTYLMS